MTIAESIARFYEDGQTWESPSGVHLEHILERKAVAKENHEGITIHRFRDGSAIVTAEEGWWALLEEAIAQGLELS